MAKPKLNLISTDDKIVLENFRRIEKVWSNEAILKGSWKFIQITITGAVTNYKFKHYLKFIPLDVIQTSKTGVGSITWNYELFDRDNLDITTTGACVVRALVGRHEEGDI